MGLQGIQHGAGPLHPTAQSLRTGTVQTVCQAPDLPQPVPKPRRQDGLDRLKHGAEVALAHPKGQSDPLTVQHRGVIQHCLQRLEPRQLFTAASGQNDALAGAVAPPEGNGDPYTGQRPFQ